MLSMCQDFGFDNSSETEPCDKPSTNSPKSCKFAKFNIGICTQQPSYVTVSLFMAGSMNNAAIFVWTVDIWDKFIVRNGFIELSKIVS